MRQLPTGGRFKAALGVIAVVAVAASAAPAFADDPASGDPAPTTTAPAYGPAYCLQDAPENTALPRYLLTNAYVDLWDGLPGTPEGYRGLRYRTHVAHQHWDSDQSQWVIDGEWDNVWGGPTNYVPSGARDYFKVEGACQNITGYPIGISAASLTP
jgi:hypothetical protein